MKRIFNNKVFIAVIFFILGFLGNYLLTKVTHAPTAEQLQAERFPVNPDDFDQAKMLDTMARMSDQDEGASVMGEISQREDADFVYYEIPLRGHDGLNHKLNVEVKNGMIKISEDSSSSGNAIVETSSERMFSIDPSLDGDRAEVINQKDKIVLKIPKRR